MALRQKASAAAREIMLTSLKDMKHYVEVFFYPKTKEVVPV
jgi:hypothetical protein